MQTRAAANAPGKLPHFVELVISKFNKLSRTISASSSLNDLPSCTGKPGVEANALVLGHNGCAQRTDTPRQAWHTNLMSGTHEERAKGLNVAFCMLSNKGGTRNSDAGGLTSGETTPIRVATPEIQLIQQGAQGGQVRHIQTGYDDQAELLRSQTYTIHNFAASAENKINNDRKISG